MSGIAEPSLLAGEPVDGRSAAARRRRRGLGVPGAVAGAVVLLAVVAAAWPALLGGADPLAVHPSEALLAPSGAHPSAPTNPDATSWPGSSPARGPRSWSVSPRP
ncbi:hypothetical protein QP157_18365 [Sphingomonas sp. LR61]|uniref:hypothetical protein n=1 Tax=Sphingomonas sp. LR61 TaxID=3050234 RepID=UPI002FDFD25C